MAPGPQGRRVRRGLALLTAALLALVTPALAQDEDELARGEQEFTCPVGGEKFKQDTSFITFPLEGYPDGGGPGVEGSDAGLPECPSNGLVLLVPYSHEQGDSQEAYTPEEIARLPALIASPEYQALRKESRAARLVWLAEKLGRPAWQRFHLLQRAAWVSRTPEERRRWMTRIAEEGEGLAASPGFPPAFAVEVRYFTVNALRELGRFDEAGAMLARLRTDEIARYRAQRGNAAPNPHVLDTDYPESLGGIEMMQQAIDQRDDDRFPVSMMGDKWARLVCDDVDDSPIPITEKTRQGCARRKAERDRMEEERALSFKLTEDGALFAKVCRQPPVGQRTELQVKACADAESQRAWHKELAERDREAERLLANPAALDKQCQGVKIGRYDTPATALGEACQKRAEALRDRETERLVKQMERNPADYDRLCHWDYPQLTSEDPLEVACERIRSERRDAQSERERAELAKLTPAQLQAKCEHPDAAGAMEFGPISYACSEMEQDRLDAKWQALLADPAKLKQTCETASLGKDDWILSRCYTLEQEKLAEAESKLEPLAWAMSKDHTALVAACQSTPHEQREAVLALACERYRKCLILPVGTRIPEKNMLRVDFLPMGPDEDVERKFYEGPQGDGHGAFCYETIEEANAAWELVKDPTKRVIDETANYNGYPVPRPKPGSKPKP